jgi:hypothetical protein
VTDADPGKFTRNLDLAEQRAIERRLVELVPYEEEAKALRRRLANIKRRLGIESTARTVERSVLQCLAENEGRLARSILIRDLHLPPDLVKSALQRLERTGKVHSVERGYWVLGPR